MTIGEIIKEKRCKKGLTQKQLADLVYSTPVAISQFENGKHMPKVDMMYSLAEVLEIPVEEFLFSEYKISDEPSDVEKGKTECYEDLCNVIGYKAGSFEFTPTSLNFYRSLKIWNPSYSFEKCLKDFVIPYVKENPEELTRFFRAYGTISKSEREVFVMKKKDNNAGYFQLSQNTKKLFEDIQYSNKNVLVVGCGGSGKEFSFVRPNLYTVNGNLFVVDVGGIKYQDEKENLEAKGYDVVEIDIQKRYNPFLVYNLTDHEISNIVNILVPDEKDHTKDPFWHIAERSVLFNVLKEMAKHPKEEWNGKLFESILESSDFEELLIPEKNLQAVKNLVSVRMGWFNIPIFNTSEYPVDFEKIMFDDKKTAIFFKVSSVDTTFDFLVKLAVNGLWERTTSAHIEYVKEHPEENDAELHSFLLENTNNMFVFLDDFERFQFDGFETQLTLSRGYNIGYFLMLQSLSQIKGDERTRNVIVLNCNTLVFMGSNDTRTCEIVSDMCNRPLKNTKPANGNIFTRALAKRNDKKIFNAAEIAKMDFDECLILEYGEIPKSDYKYGMKKH